MTRAIWLFLQILLIMGFLSTFIMNNIKDHFPILNEKINSKNLIYLDNAATTQKPNLVIDSIIEFYKHYNSNIDRGWHTLGSKTADKIENARKNIASFINAKSPKDIIFTSGTTESINLVSQTYGNINIKSGDYLFISELEHHSNILPWLEVCKKNNAFLKVIPINDNGDIDINKFEDLLIKFKPKLVAITYVSNSLGTITPIKDIVKKTHSYGGVVLVDAAQAAPHLKIDVEDLDCDFLAFSSHKMYGPTGVGVLYSKGSTLESSPPFKYGGGMIKEVSFINAIYRENPYKFEAGTLNLSGIIGLSKAIDFLNQIGLNNLYDQEQVLINYAIEKLNSIESISVIGNPGKRCGLISFLIKDIHHLDVGMMLDANGIAVRTGHHCAQPLMERYNIDGTVRISFGVYNTTSEIDELANVLHKIAKKYKKKCLA